jgi:hypothetical protein
MPQQEPHLARRGGHDRKPETEPKCQRHPTSSLMATGCPEPPSRTRTFPQFAA